MSLTTYKGARRILVVDECQEHLLLIQSILASQGYETILTQSGKTALTEISQTKIDLVILNINIPNWRDWQAFEVNNFGVTRYLKTTPEYCQIPILWLTSDRTIQLHFDFSLEVDALMYKPFEVDELLFKISFLLGDKQDCLTFTEIENTFCIQVGEQDPLRQQQAELEQVQLNHHPQAFWEKLIAEGYEIKNHKFLTAG